MRRFRFLTLSTILGAIVAFAAVTAGGNDARAANGLVAGWNNVAYLGAPAAPSEALASMAGKYSSVYRWDAAAKKYDVYAPEAPGLVNTLNTLSTGDSIWIYVTASSAELSPPASTGAPTATSGVISIPASAFFPESDLALYEKDYNQLNPVGSDADSQRYFAPVQLPQGAKVTEMTSHFTGSGVRVRLDYTPLSNGTDANQVFILAETNSTGGASPRTASAFNHSVDNTTNLYFLVVDLTDGSNSKLRGISIKYSGS
jgi:hypothetical protein